MRSSGRYVSSCFVLIALLAVSVACGTTPERPLDPPDVIDPPNVIAPPVPPPVDPPPVEPRPTVPLKDHEKVVIELTEVRGRVRELDSANAELVDKNVLLAEENKTLQAELALAKTEVEQLQKKLDAIMSPPPVLSEDPLEPGPIVELYAVQPGDNFEQIAAKTEIYGNAERWRDLYETNRERLGLTKPEDLRSGMEIEIKRP